MSLANALKHYIFMRNLVHPSARSILYNTIAALKTAYRPKIPTLNPLIISTLLVTIAVLPNQTGLHSSVHRMHLLRILAMTFRPMPASLLNAATIQHLGFLIETHRNTVYIQSKTAVVHFSKHQPKNALQQIIIYRMCQPL